MQEPIILYNDHEGYFQIVFASYTDDDEIDAVSEPIVATYFDTMEDALCFAKELYENIKASFLHNEIIHLSDVEY